MDKIGEMDKTDKMIKWGKWIKSKIL